MNRPIRCWLYFALLFPALTAFSQEKEATTIPGPPYAFQTQTIQKAHETAQRANWSEAIVQNQWPPTDNIAEQLWRQTVLTAFFPTENNRDRSLKRFQECIDHLPNLDENQIMMLLQSYDCLIAIAEQAKVSQEQRTKMLEGIHSLIGMFLDPARENKDDLTAKAALTYAALLAGNNEVYRASLQETPEKPNLVGLMRQETVGNGLSNSIPLQQQCQTYADLYQAALAVQRHSNDDWQPMQLWLSRFADVLAECLTFDTNDPASPIFESDTFPALTRCLERAALLFDSNQLRSVLERIYQTKPRLAEALLFTGTPLQSKVELPYSKAFHRTGLAILHAGNNLSAYLNTGFLPNGLLSMQPSFNTKGILPGKQSAKPGYGNTVYIDRKPHQSIDPTRQSPANGLITSFVSFGNDGTYIAASASGKYGERSAYDANTAGPVPVFERELFITDSLAVDLFRVQAKGTQDWLYSYPGTIAPGNGVSWKDKRVDREDYPFLRDRANVKTSDAVGVYPIHFQSKNVGERLWLIDPAGSELIAAQDDNQTTLIARRTFSQVAGNCFAAVHEMDTGTLPDTKIESLTLFPPPNDRHFQAVAFAIQTNGRHDIFFSATRPDIAYTATYLDRDLAVKAKFAHIRIEDNDVRVARIVGGTHLQYGKYSLTMPTAMMTGVLDRYDEAAGTIQTRFPFPLPEHGTLKGWMLNVIDPNPGQVFLQPLSIGYVSDFQETQTISLLHPVRIDAPIPELAAPMTVGSQVILQHAAELRQYDEQIFSLLHTSTIDVTIKGPPLGNRIYALQSYVKRLRGKLEDGVIHFQFQPMESLNGKIQFKRVE